MDNEYVRGDELTFKDIWNYFRKSLPIVVVCILAFCLMTGLGGLIYSLARNPKNIAVGTVGYIYPGIEDGLNPDGTRLDIETVRSVGIVERALSELNLSKVYDGGEVRNAVAVKEIIPEYRTKMLEAMKKDKMLNPEQLSKLKYQPTSFSVELDTRKMKKTKISDDDALKIVKKMIKLHRDEFIEKYINAEVLNETMLTDDDIENNDFSESLDLITIELAKAWIYVNSMERKAPSLLTNDGESFGACKSKITVLRTNRDSLFAYLTQHGIAQEKTEARLGQQIEDCKNQIENLEKAREVINSVLDAYKKDFPGITIVGTAENKLQLPFPPAHDKMLASISDNVEKVTELSNRKASLERWLSAINDVTSDSMNGCVISDLKELNGNIKSLAKDVNRLSNAYSEKICLAQVKTSAVTMISHAKSVPWLKLLLIAACVGLIVGLCIQPGVAKAVAKRKARPVSDSDAASLQGGFESVSLIEEKKTDGE